jgi:hypothetical protein
MKLAVAQETFIKLSPLLLLSLAACSSAADGRRIVSGQSPHPDTFFAFYVADPRAVPQVGVFQQQVTDVVVQLGPKAAKMILQVFDADTNDQIEGAAVELRRPEDPNAYVSLSCIPSESTGKCEILVPPLPTNIKVSKSGYDEQDLTGQLGPRPDVATLNPGETKYLSVRLRRKKAQP